MRMTGMACGVVTILTGIVVCAGGLPALAETPVARLTSEPPDPYDDFGYSVAAGGEYLVVGARYGGDHGYAVGPGQVGVYRRVGSDWVKDTQLVAPPVAADDLFGSSVSVDGDVLVVGAPCPYDPASGPGSAYVYRHQGATWVLEEVLAASDGAADDGFGISVSVSDHRVIVGAYLDDDACVPEDQLCNSGSAYVFERDGGVWTQVAKLTASDPAPWEGFGLSVSIDGDYAVVGMGVSATGSMPDAAYVFKRETVGWIQQARLSSTMDPVRWEFGWSVAIDGVHIVVGAHNMNSASGISVFERVGDVWSEQQKLMLFDGGVDWGNFGWSVALNGGSVAVGAPTEGVVYLFRYDGNGWVADRRLSAGDASSYDRLGHAVAVSGSSVIGGAPHSWSEGAGAAYVFALEDAVPTLSEWGLGAMAIAVLAAGTIMIRRQSRATPEAT